MQVKKIWDTPKESWNGCSNITFEFNGIDAKLLISFSNNKVTKQIIVHFSHVVCYKHETNYLFMPETNAYESLCEVIDSEWLQKLKNFNPEYIKENLKHFILDNQNDGRFEIIAEKYHIE